MGIFVDNSSFGKTLATFWGLLCHLKSTLTITGWHMSVVDVLHKVQKVQCCKYQKIRVTFLNVFVSSAISMIFLPTWWPFAHPVRTEHLVQ